jgi:hypothetical protein
MTHTFHSYGVELSRAHDIVNVDELIHRNGLNEKACSQVYEALFNALNPYLSARLAEWLSTPETLEIVPTPTSDRRAPLSFNLEIASLNENGDLYTRSYDLRRIVLDDIEEGNINKAAVARIIAGARDLADELQRMIDDEDYDW